MEKFKKISLVLLLFAVGFTGCYVPHPSNYTGVRTLRQVERWEKKCTEKVFKNGERVKHCKWVRSR